jgi:carbon storage regulator
MDGGARTTGGAVMLVIRRRAGEAIVLSDGVEIHVLEINGSRVKLGVVAPANVIVARKEVEEARRQNVAAAASPIPEALTVWAQAFRDEAASATRR